MMRHAAYAVASRFAAALEAENYETVAKLLSPDCEYAARGGALVGPDAIVASYQNAGKWAKANIASVTYESAVRAVNDSSAVITFVDHLEDSSLRHSYRCEQSIDIRADGKIIRIAHIEMPGEREAVDAFLQQIGVSRDAGVIPSERRAARGSRAGKSG